MESDGAAGEKEQNQNNNRMIRTLQFLVLIAALFLFVSCTTAKKIPYMQDAGSFIRQKIPESYQIKIDNDDLLAILVSSKDSLLAQPFNHTPEKQGYLVDAAGYINFPILGELKVNGLTPDRLADTLRRSSIPPTTFSGRTTWYM
jgi:polysaccharide export outer membrane protein